MVIRPQAVPAPHSCLIQRFPPCYWVTSRRQISLIINPLSPRLPLPSSLSKWWSLCRKPLDNLMLWGHSALMHLCPRAAQWSFMYVTASCGHILILLNQPQIPQTPYKPTLDADWLNPSEPFFGGILIWGEEVMSNWQQGAEAERHSDKRR